MVLVATKLPCLRVMVRFCVHYGIRAGTGESKLGCFTLAPEMVLSLAWSCQWGAAEVAL